MGIDFLTPENEQDETAKNRCSEGLCCYIACFYEEKTKDKAFPAYAYIDAFRPDTTSGIYWALVHNQEGDEIRSLFCFLMAQLTDEEFHEVAKEGSCKVQYDFCRRNLFK